MAEYLDNDAQWSDPIERASGGESGGVAKWQSRDSDGTDAQFHAVGDLCIVLPAKVAVNISGSTDETSFIKGDDSIPDFCKPAGDGLFIGTNERLQGRPLSAYGTETVASGQSYGPSRLAICIWPINPIE